MSDGARPPQRGITGTAFADKPFGTLMRDSFFYRKLFSLTLPMAFQELMLASVAAADAIMLGNVGQNMMTAVSLATQIQFIQNMVIYTIVSALAVLGAQYWGKGDKRSLNDVFCTGLRLSFIVSLLFFTGCVFFPSQLMRIFTNEQVLIDLGAGYLRIAGWSYLLTGITQNYLRIMKLSEHQTMAAVISSTAVIINIFGNAVFIFGLFGLPKMGVMGAAVSTLIARVIEFVWTVSLSFRRDYVRPHVKNLFHVNRTLSRDFLRLFFPLLGAGLLWGVGFTSYSAFMGHLGTDAAAANSVAAVVRDLVCCACNGLAGAAGIIVGNELGKGDLEKGRKYGVRLAKISFICGGASTVLILALTPVLVSLVRLTDGARGFLVGMMVITAFYMIGRCVNTIIINGIYSAGGDTAFDFYSLAIVMWGLAVPLALLGTFVFHWNPLIVFACTCLDEVGKIPWVMVHFKKYKWVRDLTR